MGQSPGTGRSPAVKSAGIVMKSQTALFHTTITPVHVGQSLWTRALRYVRGTQADLLPPLLPEDGWETRSSSGNTIAPTWKCQDAAKPLPVIARRRKELIQVPSQGVLEGRCGWFSFKISLNPKPKPASGLDLFLFTTM